MGPLGGHRRRRERALDGVDEARCGARAGAVCWLGHLVARRIVRRGGSATVERPGRVYGRHDIQQVRGQGEEAHKSNTRHNLAGGGAAYWSHISPTHAIQGKQHGIQFERNTSSRYIFTSRSPISESESPEPSLSSLFSSSSPSSDSDSDSSSLSLSLKVSEINSSPSWPSSAVSIAASFATSPKDSTLPSPERPAT